MLAKATIISCSAEADMSYQRHSGEIVEVSCLDWKAVAGERW